MKLTFGEQLRAHRIRAGLSVRKAAQEAGFSEGLWRQLEKGYRAVTADVRVPAAPTAAKVIQAAAVLDWFVLDALEAAGLSEDARMMEQAFHEQAVEQDRAETELEGFVADEKGSEPPLTDQEEAALQQKIREGLDAMDQLRKRRQP